MSKVERFGDLKCWQEARISSSSAMEVNSVCYVALDLDYWSQEIVGRIQNKAEEVKALDLGLIRYLNGRK